MGKLGHEFEYHVRASGIPLRAKKIKKNGGGNMDTIIDELQAAIDTLFGLRQPDGRIKKFATLHDLYSYYTGDDNISGVFNPRRLPSELRGNMSITASTFPNALSNSLNRFLSAGYDKINYFEDILISQKSPATYLHEGSFVQLGCWEDLPDIDPETENYPDMANIAEATNAFDLLQKGCVIPISRKTLLADDLGLIKKLMERLGLVARKTHARYVWNFFINNSNCNDGTAWFTSGHGNLGSSAISISAVTTAITALAAMVEPGPSTDLLGIDLSKPQFHLTVAPSAWDDAVRVNQTKYTYSSNDLTAQVTNPCYRLFGDHNERIATPPFISGSDWGVIRDREEIPIIEMQYLDGQEEPVIRFEQNPESDMAYKGDFFGLKARHEYAGSLSDYRGGYKSAP